MTSHAAIVARGMGKTCVVGATEIEVDAAGGRFRANGRVVKRGQVLTVDGTTGRVILGAAKLVEPTVGGHYGKLMAWADARRRLRVRANADTPADARRARKFGAEGIGLCLPRDRKSTRLNSSHGYISYAVFCLKKKKTHTI